MDADLVAHERPLDGVRRRLSVKRMQSELVDVDLRSSRDAKRDDFENRRRKREAIGRLQRPRVPGRRASGNRGGAHPDVGAGGGCRNGAQPRAVAREIEGGTAQGIGSALYEEVLADEGVVTTSSLRNYRMPKIGDVPPTEVLFAETHDPLGAKSMSEAPYNPVAPALANAIRDALGVRPFELPMSRDRVWRLARDAG
jgi:hypothetical protein